MLGIREKSFFRLLSILSYLSEIITDLKINHNKLIHNLN